MLSLKSLSRSRFLKWYIAFKVVQAVILIKLYRDRKKKARATKLTPADVPVCDSDLCSVYRNNNYASTKDDWTITGGLV